MKDSSTRRNTRMTNRNAPNGAGDRSHEAADLVVPGALPLSTRPSVDASRVDEPRVAFGLDLDPAPAHHQEFEQLVRRMLELLGEAPERAGHLRTPQRVANALTWLTRGYGLTAAELIGNAIFEESHESMIMVRDIELYSLCEHHLLPLFGRAHVAYIPHGRIVGLSKIPRASSRSMPAAFGCRNASPRRSPRR